MSRRGMWGALFGAQERDRFSAEELRHLHGVLLRNQVVTDANRDVVVEALRSIAELVIWGDQNDSSVVDYFLTENLLAHFNQILQQRSNRRGNVATQVLQTLSILIQNVRNQQTVYYLFSNNHINEVVSMRFDFDDDEVLGYYVNLLKTISLKLNEVTVQFFFQQLPGGGASFPLYTEAVKFVNHRDGMVRAAVKALTLNVFAIPLPALQRFVAQRPASTFLEQLAAYVAEQCQVLDRLLSSWDVASPQAPASLEACLAEIEDLLSYCNDVLTTGVPALCDLLTECLWRGFVGPILLWPLIQEDVAAQHITALSLGSSTPRGSNSSGGGSLAGGGGQLGGGGSEAEGGAGPKGAGNGSLSRGGMPRGVSQTVEQGSVGPLCSLYVLERLLLAVTHQPLLTTVLAALLGGPAAGGPHLTSPATTPSKQQQQQQQQQPSSSPGAAGGGSQQQQYASSRAAELASAAAACCPPPAQHLPPGLPLPAPLLVRLQYSPAAYRRAFLDMLRGSDAQLAAAAVRVCAAMLRSRAVGEDLLEVLGMLPRRRRKQQQLLAALTAGSSFSVHHSGGAAAPAAPPNNTSAQQAQQQQQQGSLAPVANGSIGGLQEGPSPADGIAVVGSSSDASKDGRKLDNDDPHLPYTHQKSAASAAARGGYTPSSAASEQAAAAAAGSGGSSGSGSSYGDQQFSEVVAALLALLGCDLLPPISLLTLGWLLNQLLSVGLTGAELSSPHSAALAAAVRQRQLGAHAQLEGPWCDVMGSLVGMEWGRAREAVLRTGGGSVHVAVYTWMQGILAQELQWQLAGREEAEPGPAAQDAATSAKQAYLAMLSLVALTQIAQLLQEGSVPSTPPIPLPQQLQQLQAAPPSGAAGGGGAAGAGGAEIGERSHIPLNQWLSCVVAFQKGQERKVYFSVEGMPRYVPEAHSPVAGSGVRSPALPGSPARKAAGPAAAAAAPGAVEAAAKGGESTKVPTARELDGAGSVARQLASVSPEALAAAVAAAAPVVVVADPGPRPNVGVVLSAAPLLGSLPRIDEGHPRWLHVQVRPQARALLRVLAGSHPGNALLNLDRQLAPGHWVLAFPQPDKALAARQLVEESARSMRALHRQLLAPLLGSPPAVEATEAAPAAAGS